MARMSLDDFSAQLTHALGARLGTLLLYGSAARSGASKTAAAPGMNTLLIVAGDGAADDALLSTLAEPVRAWVAAGHPPPLILTGREWRESADAFPIEYEDIREAHRVLAGGDPWPGITVARDHVRRQLEHELKGKLMHLRQAYAAAWGRPKQLAEIVRETRPGFLAMLRAALRLAGRVPPAEPEALVRAAGILIGFAPEALTEPAAYLSAVTRTAEYVNRLERTFS
jgi:hypothetical protein